MPTETIEHKSGAASIEAPATGSTDAAVDRDATPPRADPGSKPASKQRFTRRRKLLIGVLGAVVIAAAVFGIPWIRFVLSTVSTDDAFVNGHVTFVAPRVHGQVSRVLVDDNNRVHKGDLLVELDKEPFRDAVAVKKAAVDTAQADLQAARATVRGIEAQARSRRWQLQQAVENVENQIALLHARVAALKKAKATLVLAQQEFDRTSQLVVSDTASRELYDQRQAALSIAQAGVVQALADANQIRVSLGLQAQPEDSADLDQVPPDLDQTFSSVLQAQAELIQAAAELGVVHSYNQSPKQMLEEFEKLDPKATSTARSTGWPRKRRPSSKPKPNSKPPNAISLWLNSTFAIVTSSRRSTASSRAETSIPAMTFRSDRA